MTSGGPQGGLPRSTLLTHLARTNAAISVHEHAGREVLLLPDGGTVVHEQAVEELGRRLLVLGLQSVLPGSAACAAAVFPMPVYEVFRKRDVAAEGGVEDDIYLGRNRTLLLACAAAQTGGSRGAYWPLPVLAVDPTADAQAFEQRYEDALPRICGLKWHPFAQARPVTDYVEKGYLDLAARHRWPTIVHCSRPSLAGDLDELLPLVRHARDLDTAVCVAHAGFLHPRLVDLAEAHSLYIDIAPWNLICDSGIPGTSKEARIDRLTALLEQFDDLALFGLDTPWSTVVFPGGAHYGSTASEDLEVCLVASAAVGADHRQGLFHDHALRFLQGRPPKPLRP